MGPGAAPTADRVAAIAPLRVRSWAPRELRRRRGGECEHAAGPSATATRASINAAAHSAAAEVAVTAVVTMVVTALGVRVTNSQNMTKLL